MKYHALTLLSIFSISFFNVSAQTNSCGTDKQMKEYYQRNPQAFIDAKNFDLFTRKFSDTVKVKSNNAGKTNLHTYTIPVVVHVLASSFNSPSATVTLAKMRTAIEKTNEDFQGLNPEYPGIPAIFSGLKNTMDIQFELAQIDPAGNPTTGVIFHPFTEKGFGNGSGYDAKIQSYAWDNYKYMNVYIMYDLYNNGAFTNSGVAWYPDAGMSNSNLARVVYNGSYIYGNTTNSFAHVLTHEFGHFFNLIHTFEGGCVANPALGDQVADTPPTVGSQGCSTPTNNCFGNPVNLENFMDYNTVCQGMYTTGQVNRATAATLHSARQPLWQPANLTVTGVDGVVRKTIGNADSCTYTFREVNISNGAIVNPITLEAKNGALFAQSSGTWTQGVHYTVQNLPAGLSMSITITDNTHAVISLSGNAAAHAAANSISNLKINFLDAGIAGGVSTIFNSLLTFKISFKDPLGIVYGDNNFNTTYVQEISSCQTWAPFNLGTLSADFGLYHLGSLRFESYEKGVMCQTGTTNIKPLNDGDIVGPSGTEWNSAGPYPNEHYITKAGYTAWHGQIKAIGVRFTDDHGSTVYGWIRIRVSDDGLKMSLIDYAYNQQADQPITVGAGAAPILAPELEDFIEADANDGSIITQQPYNLVGKTFAMSSGTLIKDVHYTRSTLITGSPEPVLTLVNNKKVILSFPGNFANHAVANGFAVHLTYLNAAFTGGNAAGVRGYSRAFNNSIYFKDPHHDEKVIINQTIDPVNYWYWFQMKSNLPISLYLRPFGLWHVSNYLKLEAYGQPVVTNGSTSDISLLTPGTVIGPSSNWNTNTANPNQPNLTSATYTAWHNKEGYIGIHTMDFYCNNYYGYLHVTVSADGKSVIFHDYAYNTLPGAPITVPLPLPLSLKDFTVEEKDCAASLNWVTASEINTANFEVQMSIDGGANFSTVKIVTASGNSTSEIKYKASYALDRSVPYLFRLKMNDKDGKFSYSKTASVSCTDPITSIRVFPNPASGVVFIKGMSPGKNNISISTSDGRLVKYETVKNTEAEIDISGLSFGFYIIKIRNENGNMKYQKLVKK